MAEAPPQPIGCATALKLERTSVALNVKGGLDMAKFSLNLPEDNSEHGVTLETIEAYAKTRGFRSAEECINRLLAGTLGYTPADQEAAEPQYPQLAKLFEGIADKP